MQKINKILNIVTIVMFVITVVLLGLFYFGGELPNSQYVTPVYTEQLLWWSYLLFGVAIVAALVFPIARLFTRPKEAMKSFIALAGIIVLVLIAYSMSDGTIPPELYEKYLGIILFETERLTDLTNDLLTLNEFDTKELLLDKTIRLQLY